jgi:hypothetical protein
MILWAASAHAATTWYVDSSVASSGNGQSWATAWKALSNIAGLSAGDTVYISGGPSGGTGRTYGGTTVTPYAGSASGRITYKIGQDSQHNGIATFTTTYFVTQNYVNVVGDAGDGKRHFVWTTNGRATDNKSHIRVGYVNLGQRNSYGFYANNGTDIEIDHIYYYKTNGGDDAFAYFETVASGSYGVNSIHDNVIYLPRNDNGLN